MTAPDHRSLDETASPTVVRRPAPRPLVALRLTLLVAVVAVAVLVHARTDGSVLSDVCYLGVLLGAAAGAWWGALRAPAGERLVPRLIASGLTLSGLADVVWTLLERAGADTDASVADVLWAAAYLALAATLWLVLRHDQVAGRDGFDAALDVLTIVVVGVVVLWDSSVASILTDSDLTPFERSVTAAYPVADAVLLALVARVLVTRRGRRRLGLTFAAGVTLWLAADLAYLTWPDDPTGTALSDAAWMVSPVLMAYAAWPARSPAAPPEVPHAPHVSLPLVLVAVGPLLVPPVLEVLADVGGEPDRPWRLLLSMVALVTLAFVRSARVLRSERRAHQDLERARDAALAASEAKSVFLANMGHEIRTPLTSVLAAAEMLEDTDLDPVQQHLLLKMQRSGGLLRDLVERVLDFSRLAGGEVVLRPTDFDPAALVADVVEAYEARAQALGLELTSYVDPATPSVVTADLVRVFQVLTNLLDNAFKFTTEGGVRLEVLAGQDDGTVRFAVSDTGIGIPDEDRLVVFDLFRQLDDSVTRSYGGSGLGLAICKQLATALGGSVSVSSRDGGGSRFELRLPVTPSDGPSPG